jgi:hypothetical protein
MLFMFDHYQAPQVIAGRPAQLLQGREVEQDRQRIEEMLFGGNSAEQLLAVVPLADFIVFPNYVSVTEGTQEPA